MDVYSGENLLKLFNELNIQLLNLHPNVVRAWFDTDCKDMKYFLNWMCSSLSQENYVSPLEYAEFLEIKEPFVGQDYIDEVNKLQSKFPGLLDVETNINEIALLEQEVKLLADQNVNFDELIATYEIIQNDLVKDLSDIEMKKVQTSLKCKKAQEYCSILSEQLDNVNQKLHTQITKYSHNLQAFENAAVPKFINHIDITQCEQNLESINSLLNPILDDYLSSSISSTTSNKLSFVSSSDTFISDIGNLRDRILQSHKILTFNQIEIETFREVLRFLQSNNVDSLMTLKENAYTPPLLQSKELSQKRMCEVLDHGLERHADYCISETKLKYACQELEDCQSRLANVSDISNLISKLLVQYVIINLLHTIEHKDIAGSTSFFRKIFYYISGEVQKCQLRTNEMNEVIDKYEKFLTSDTSEGEQFKLIKSVFNVLSEKQFTLREAVEVVTNLENELELKKRQPFKGFEELQPLAHKAKTDIRNLQSFLTSGPTYRVEIVPFTLKQILDAVEQHFKKEDVSVRTATTIFKSKVNSLTQWQNKKRQLWMYFMENPSKMSILLQELEEAGKKNH